MSITTISSRQFNQDAGGAKKAASLGPVFITDRGRPAHVLLTFEAYQQLVGAEPSLLQALAQSGGGDLDFEPPRLNGVIAEPADLD
ncbi:MAG: type II toxin-antitoxin system Phd/YefM family antitoxin [Rhodospirillales bacterium]|nr:type II toxin-antitoxin system Phd/YefM family antitoxin [Rhodospirillales bacterium]